MGAAFLIYEGCPDDTFDYFRSWLIVRGRGVFEAALEDPDSLAFVATPEALDDDVYCAGETALRAMGRTVNWDGKSWPPLKKNFDFNDKKEMRHRYPKLYERFATA